MYVLYNKETGEFLRYNGLVLRWKHPQVAVNLNFSCVEVDEQVEELIFNQNVNNEN